MGEERNQLQDSATMWRSELPGLRELEIWTRKDKMEVSRSRLLVLREIEVDVLK